MQGAWKVGLLVVVFVGLLFGAYAILGKSLFAKKADLYYAEFEDATGLALGGAVLMAGVKVGSIQDIQLTEIGTAKVSIALEEGRRIPAGSSAMVQGQLIGFGDSPLVILAPPGKSSTFLSPGDILAGRKGSPMDNLFPEFKTTAQEMNKTLIAARELIGDAKIKNSLTNLIDSAAKTADRFGKLAGDVQGVLADNKASIKSAMNSLASAMKDVQEGAKLAANLLKDDRWKTEAEGLLAKLSETAGKADTLMANLNELVTDPKLRDPINASAANIQSITESGTKIAANTEEMTKNGIEISKNVAEVTRKASELADDAREVLQKLKEFFQKVPSTSGIKNMTTEMDLHHQSGPSYWRTDFTATFPTEDGRFIAGVFDAFEGNKLTLQYGKDVTKNIGYRYGVYASKPGAGVDWRLAARWDLRGDFYDINDPTFDLRSRFDLGNGWLGWIGVDKVFRKNALSLGVGIRK
ncbi:MAG: MCE family protein [Armatimonadetes bacterium]|nr:MCE family protein [Armatimonadota bacterium]